MVDLALILYQIYISPNAAGPRLGALKGIGDISAAFHFLVVRASTP